MYFPIKTARLEQALNGLVKPFTDKNNINNRLRREKATKENVRKLNKYYSSKGIDFQVIPDIASRIENMPYNQTVNLEFIQGSRIQPLVLQEGAFEPLNYSLPYGKYNDTYVPLGCVEKTIKLPSMTDKNGTRWMSPVYFEETTMRPSVDKAKGQVLKFGLGIGFFPFNCLLKDEVEKVTVIERDLDVIETFKRDILPQFPRKEAIEIIHGDAFDFLDTHFLKRFDFVFADIWLNNDDGTVILSKMLAKMDLDTALNDDHIHYWIEGSILIYLLASVGTYLLLDYHGDLDTKLTGVIQDSDEIENYVTFDKVHRFMQENYAEITFKNDKELLNLVKSRTFLLSLLRSLSM